MAPNPSSRLPSSRPASGLFPPSSTSAATAQYSSDRSIIFASEWHFKPEGIKLVKQRFEEQLLGRRIEAVHGWNEEDQTFRIRCYPQDTNLVWALFYNIFAKIIKDETEHEGEEEDQEWTCIEDRPVQSDLIESLEEYRKTTMNDETADQEPTKQDPSGAEPDNHTESFPEEIKYFKSRNIWPQNVDLNAKLALDLDKIASDEDIKELEVLTGCRLVKVLNEHNIYIGGNSEGNCNPAFRKLDILRKYQSMKPYNNHVFYSEAEENFQLVLKPIVDIKKSYFETTLLETLQLRPQCNYRNLANAVTVRIALYSHERCLYFSVKNLKFTPAVKLEDKDCGLTEWAQFKYSSTCNSSMYHQDHVSQPTLAVSGQNAPGPMQPTPVQPVIEPITNRENKDASIQRWAQDIPVIAIRPVGNPLQEFPKFGAVAPNPGSTNQNDSKPAWDSYKHFDNTLVLRNESKPRQLSNGLVNNLSRMASAVSTHGAATLPQRALQTLDPQASIQNPRSRTPIIDHPTPPSQKNRQRASRISTAQPATDILPQKGSVSPTRTVSASEFFHGLITPESDFSVVTPRSVSQASADNTSNFDSFFYRPPERSILDDAISVVDFTDPILQPMNMVAIAAEPLNTRRLGLENLQALSEVQTRTFHNTMNQRAPKPKYNPYAGRLPGPAAKPARAGFAFANNTPVINPLPEFIQELEEDFQYLMQPVQGFRGQVQVQAEFGRILLNSIHRKHVTSKGATDCTKDPEQLQSLLDSADCTSFTNVLTTSSGEMPYLLNLTDEKGKELWEKENPDWTVEYEFCFVDRLATHENSRFRVVIDAESFATRIEKSCPLDDIYIHGICRHWDIKISATGIESGGQLEEKYGALGEAVKSSLCVPKESSTPILSFQLDEPMSKRFELAGVRVYRICQFKSKDAKSILKISELHLLDIEPFRGLEKSLTCFKLLPGPADREPCAGLGHWFEVGISSVHLDSLLEQNKTLELGEEAVWTPEKVSDLDIAKSIYLPACEMLKKMDGIGQHNRNRVEVRAGLSTATSQVSPKPKEEFW